MFNAFFKKVTFKRFSYVMKKNSQKTLKYIVLYFFSTSFLKKVS